jgi:hypothetical protein
VSCRERKYNTDPAIALLGLAILWELFWRGLVIGLAVGFVVLMFL